MKSGFIAVLGLPNAGKSTLTNALVGEKVSIVSWRPQTTRDKIIGIVNGEDYQIVLIDTPGIHVGKSKLSAFMAEEVTSAKSSSDGTLYVLDGSKTMEKDTFEFIKSLASTTPTVVVVNKMDIADKAAVMQTVARLSSVKNLEIVPISAATKENLDELLSVVKGMLKDDVAYYPEDMYTDKPLRFMAAEIVREKALKFLLAEIPHGIGVEVVKFETGEDGVTHHRQRGRDPQKDLRRREEGTGRPRGRAGLPSFVRQGKKRVEGRRRRAAFFGIRKKVI